MPSHCVPGLSERRRHARTSAKVSREHITRKEKPAMANKEIPGGSPKQPLQQDSLVEQLAPGKGRSTIQLTGWLEKGSEADSWKLYLTPKLDEYVQFSEKDLVNSRQLPTESSPLGGTIIWLNADSTLQYVKVIGQREQAGFLSGGITSAYLAGSASYLPDAPTPRNLGAMIGTYTANWHIPACQAPTTNCYQTKVYPCTLEPISCGTNNAFCTTREFVC